MPVNDRDFVSLIQGFLKALHLRVPRRYILQQLPYGNGRYTMKSITDALDQMGIDNMAVEVEKDQLHQLPNPFLAHTSSQEKGSDLVLIKDTDRFLARHPGFSQEWTGKVVLVKEDARINPGPMDSFNRERRSEVIIISGLAFLMIAGILSILVREWSLVRAMTLATTITGVILGILIFMTRLGLEPAITEKACSAFGTSGCGELITGKSPIRSGWAFLSDLAPIYFLGQLIAMIVLSARGEAMMLQLLVPGALPAVLAIVYSLFYQVSRQIFCGLCMMVNIVLSLQLGLTVISFRKGFPLHNWNAVSIALFTGMCSSIVLYLLFKGYYAQQRKLDQTTASLTRFKKHPQVLIPALQKGAPRESVRFSDDILLGNPDAAIRMTVLCAPFCKPCARLHDLLHPLILEGKADCNLSIRFVYDGPDVNSPANLAVAYLIECFLQARRIEDWETRTRYIFNLLHDWYSQTGLPKFTVRHPAQREPNIDQALAEHAFWWMHSGVHYTPTLWVDGIRIREPYSPFDIELILPALKEYLSNVKD